MTYINYCPCCKKQVPIQTIGNLNTTIDILGKKHSVEQITFCLICNEPIIIPKYNKTCFSHVNNIKSTNSFNELYALFTYNPKAIKQYGIRRFNVKGVNFIINDSVYMQICNYHDTYGLFGNKDSFNKSNVDFNLIKLLSKHFNIEDSGHSR